MRTYEELTKLIAQFTDETLQILWDELTPEERIWVFKGFRHSQSLIQDYLEVNF